MRIDYDELRRIHRLEKNTSKLVEVDDDFIDSLQAFVEEEKKKYLASLKNFSASDAREFTNLKRVVEEIFLMRQKKLLNKALISSRTKEVDGEKMSTQEKEAFRKLLRILEDQFSFYESLFGEKEKREAEMVSLKILKDVPTFVGTDMKEYGPFSDGEEVELPAKIAKLFLSRKIAEEK
jgi:DNA replication initiation complex subunit (GINS family)